MIAELPPIVESEESFFAHSPGIIKLFGALAKCQGELPVIPKSSTNPYFNSKYADLAEIVKLASPIVAEYGLAVTHLVGTDDTGHTTLTTILLHESGEWMGDRMTLIMTKQDAQAQGSSITYARRYAYCAILNIVSEAEDDDGNEAAKNAVKSAPKPAATTQTRQAPTPTQALSEDKAKPWIKTLAIHANEVAGKLKVDSTQLRHAAVHLATDGKTTSTTQIDRLEALRTNQILHSVDIGDAQLKNDPSLDGTLIIVEDF